MRLHLYNIPSIDQYVNQIISQYLKYSQQLNHGDILQVDRINRLQQKSKLLLGNIDAFMNQNCLDLRVGYLYASRNKLFKFLEKIKQNKLIKQVNNLKDSQKKQIPEALTQIQFYSKSKQSFSIQKQTILIESDRKQAQQLHECQNMQSNKKCQIITNLSEIKQLYVQQNRRTPHNNYYNKQVKAKLLAQNSHLLKNQTLSAMNKPLMRQQQKQKILGSYKLKQANNKSVTRIKTSKKTQSFTPRKVTSNNNASQHHGNSNNKSSSKKVDQNSRISEKMSDIFPSQEKRSRNYSDHSNNQLNINDSPYAEFTPTSYRYNQRDVTEGTLKQKQLKADSQRHFIGESNMEQNQNENQRKRHLQKQSINSSAVKNLANLIFTIKMTKKQYNQFMKIKQEHQGKPMFQ